MRLEPARSAEPPISSGKTGARPSMISCDALRVAMLDAFARVLIGEFAHARGEICRQLAAHASPQFAGLLRIQARVLGHRSVPGELQDYALAARIPQLVHVRGNLERCVVPLDCGARSRDLLLAERRAVRIVSARLVRRSLSRSLSCSR